MGKIVKFCSSCDEGFAEKFSFCPNCGGQLQAFEMNPVVAETKPVAEPPQFVAPIVETPKIVEEPKAEAFNETKFEPAETAAYSFETAPLDNSFIEKKVEDKPTSKNKEIVAEAEAPIVEEPKITVSKAKSEKTVVATAPTVVNAGYQTFVEGASTNSSRKDTYSNADNNEGDFKVTVIEEKSKQKNILLLASLAFMTVLLSVSFIYSLFNKDFGIGAIETGDYLALVPEIEPVPIESEPPPKEEKKDDGGGGGGGGRDEKTPVQDGRLATQVDKPFIAPTKTITQVTNPDIKIQAATQGNIQRPIENKPYGLPGGTGQNSDGMGSGGGMGSGRGTGMGNGVGTGEGNGIGSGSGNGNGDGIGNGRGSGGPGSPPPPPAKPVGVTVARKIISKPQARYTDAARQNSVQGTVSVRVTFLASGQIGSVVAVNGLPYGLTEQALAAARSIRFEPAKKDGVPITTQATIQYSFTIY